MDPEKIKLWFKPASFIPNFGYINLCDTIKVIMQPKMFKGVRLLTYMQVLQSFIFKKNGREYF